ncbi:hypothetical protein CONPUDRAFT_105630 [Coniophora puteana RWD-64-598 SS2]|uniref:Actin-like ATPase domain-containing protein n=1 Tax=Coniophora puteana (strain RWD-64-598) TaxID=741705 RepID=A0A5M3MN21_CONPW|nr:uncharacterized protein CONPUDRAFT_105630 [Coniophora puteana RWD-64-598 SS2]EIW80579.1 hypothetical protein CONPUDRAFT_105630 [Coniophora puteana RWD-64-598 SS2]
MLDRPPYQGPYRKLVLAFDVGTTFSGISYCILDPGEAPHIQGVTRYPAQEHVGGASKIPSILYYDRSQHVRAVGAEALQEHIVEQAEDEQWIKVEWWKMHLRSKHLSATHISDNDIPPLPLGVSAIQVLTDFMRYLFHCARIYIQETHANGEQLWSSFGEDIDFVLSHPNGWEGAQQSQIRHAAVLAGLVPDASRGSQDRISLVTEGEASLHYCVSNILASDTWSRVPIEKSNDDREASSGSEPRSSGTREPDGGVIVVDAGGGTVDLSAYSMKSGARSGPALSFTEVAPAECRLQGSVFVTRRAHGYLKEKLKDSRFSDEDYINQMADVFDKSSKLRFRRAEDPCYIKFGTSRDKDPAYNIRGGQLKLRGEEVATLFEPSIQSIVDAIENQRKASSKPISLVFLVGGFAASDYLFAQLQDRLVTYGINISRPDNHANKAVADGAVSFYLDCLVSSRVAKFTYGFICDTQYIANDPEFRARNHKIYTSVSGTQAIPGAFRSILKKGTRVFETQEFSRWITDEGTSRSELKRRRGVITVYRGSKADPRWADEEEDMFTHLCTIKADATEAARNLQVQHRGSHSYYRIAYRIILHFGLTELRAQLAWMENGVEKQSPATVVYDDEMR